MKIFTYYAKVFAFILTLTFICLIIHSLICLDISNLKINIHSITKNYISLKLIYPIFYILLGYSIYVYSKTIDSQSNILIIATIYLVLILLVMLSSLLLFKFANFIFAFWLCLISFFIDICLSVFFVRQTVCNFHLSILFYLTFVLFYFYCNTLV